MNNENKEPIFEFDLTLIADFFRALDRQGPGGDEQTIRALGFLPATGPGLRVADIGCGTGRQTEVLARHLDGTITAVDLLPGMIEELRARMKRTGLSEKVTALVGSMDELPFGDEELDLIWAEGSIYNIGFERGLKEWRDYLKTGGYIAVSECSWFTAERPAEIHDFWMAHYPEIDTIPNKVARMQDAGYVPVATFVLPENCWTEHFFFPCVRIQDAFLQKHAGSRTAEEFIAGQRREMELYRKYKEFYGYAFYIGKKI